MRTTASSKRKFTTKSKPTHVPVRQAIIYKTTPFSYSSKSTQPQPVFIKDNQDVTSIYEPHPLLQNNRMILQKAFTAFSANVWSASPEKFLPSRMRREEDKIITAIDIELYCAPDVHPVTGKKISKYQTLAKYPVTKEKWTTSWGKEWCNLTQGDDKTVTEGTDSLFVIIPGEIRNIPKDQTVTYARMVVDYLPQNMIPTKSK